MNDEIIKSLAAILKERLDSIERYDLESCPRSFSEYRDMYVREGGEWVKWEDVCKALVLPN